MKHGLGGLFMVLAATGANADQAVLTVSNGAQGGLHTTTIPVADVDACEALAVVNYQLLVNSSYRTSGVAVTCLSDDGRPKGAFVCNSEANDVCVPVKFKMD